MTSPASLQHSETTRLSWLWLLVGFALLPFTVVQTMLPPAAWLAPIFLLRFARTARQAWLALPLIFLAYSVSYAIAGRGGETGSLYVTVIALITFELFRAVASMLPYALDRVIGSRLDQKTRALVFPLAFTAIDWALTLVPATNSTASPVYSQYDSLALMQILSVTGVWGIVFLIGWSASAINALWASGFDWRPVRGVVAPFVVVLIGVAFYGSMRLNFAPPSAPTIVAATIVPDGAVRDRAISRPFDWITFNRATDSERTALRPRFQATADQMLERSETALRAGAKLVGWQETAALVLEEDRQGLLDRASALATRYGAYIQIGVGVFTRTEAMPYFLNQSVLIDDAGKVAWTYEKAFPVIPGESYVTPYGPGRLPVADTPYGRIGTAICNDFHFQRLIRQAGRNDVDIMMAPYNDLHPFEQQDAVVSIMRAIENGYSMVRATGVGASLVTDYRGRVLATQNYGDGGGVMLATIPTHGVTTIYSRIGDMVAYICVAGLIVLAIRAYRRKVAEVAPIAAERNVALRR